MKPNVGDGDASRGAQVGPRAAQAQRRRSLLQGPSRLGALKETPL